MPAKQRPTRAPKTTPSPKTEQKQANKGRAAPPKTSDDQIVERGRAAWERLIPSADTTLKDIEECPAARCKRLLLRN